MLKLKRTQMYFSEELLRELKKKAEREETTIAHIVRSAVLDFLRREEKRDWAKDPLWNMVGSSESHDGDLSANHDKYLYEKKK